MYVNAIVGNQVVLSERLQSRQIFSSAHSVSLNRFNSNDTGSKDHGCTQKKDSKRTIADLIISVCLSVSGWHSSLGPPCFLQQGNKS